MLRLFNLFGQSAALNALDDALRASGVHPLLVPDAVKLTVVRLARQQTPAETGARADLSRSRFGETAQLLGYCMLGRGPFSESNGTPSADRAEQRMQAAIDAGDSADAKLVLLALHAGLAAPDIADRIDAEDR